MALFLRRKSCPPLHQASRTRPAQRWHLVCVVPRCWPHRRRESLLRWRRREGSPQITKKLCAPWLCRAAWGVRPRPAAHGGAEGGWARGSPEGRAGDASSGSWQGAVALSVSANVFGRSRHPSPFKIQGSCCFPGKRGDPQPGATGSLQPQGVTFKWWTQLYSHCRNSHRRNDSLMAESGPSRCCRDGTPGPPHGDWVE